MNTQSISAATMSNTSRMLRWANLAFMLYLLLLAVAMVGTGFKWSVGEEANLRVSCSEHFLEVFLPAHL